MGGLISCWSVTNFQILWNVPSMNGCGRSSELSIEFEGMTGGSSEYLLSGMNPSGMDLSIVKRGSLEFEDCSSCAFLFRKVKLIDSGGAWRVVCGLLRFGWCGDDGWGVFVVWGLLRWVIFRGGSASVLDPLTLNFVRHCCCCYWRCCRVIWLSFWSLLTFCIWLIHF